MRLRVFTRDLKIVLPQMQQLIQALVAGVCAADSSGFALATDQALNPRMEEMRIKKQKAVPGFLSRLVFSDGRISLQRRKDLQ